MQIWPKPFFSKRKIFIAVSESLHMALTIILSLLAIFMYYIWKEFIFRQQLLYFSRRPRSFSPSSSQPLSPPCWPPLSSLWIRWWISMIDRYVLLSCTLNIWIFWGTPFDIWHIEIDFLVTSSCIRFDRLFNNTSMH